MLSAAEAAMDATAQDDTERQRNRAKLYAPPAGKRPRRAATTASAPAGGGMSVDQAQVLMAQMAAQDAQFRGRRSG